MLAASDVALKVLRVVGGRLRRLVGIIEELSFSTVRHRLAALLVRLAKSNSARKGNGVTITLPANNNELAAQIGTVRELVSRNLSRLQSEGLIQLDGRVVIIPDLSKLEAELGGTAVTVFEGRTGARGAGNLAAFLTLLLAGAVIVAESSPSFAEGRSAMPFSINSSAFSPGAEIPKEFTCDAADVSPALEWRGAPTKTVTFALVTDDPDAPAGTWVHWVLWNLPATAHSLPGGVAKREQLDDGTRQGRNDFRKVGYNGPCPPPGNARQELDAAMKGRILGEAEYMGMFRR